MVEERDSYLAYSLYSACRSIQPGQNVVGVVGIGHAAGIKKVWPNVEQVDMEEIMRYVWKPLLACTLTLA